MRPEHPPLAFGPLVRVRCTFAKTLPFCDLIVEVKDPQKPTGWREIARYNDERDEALEQACIAATGARRSLLEGERV